MYGSPCEGTSGSTGYRGDNLNEHPWSFAELGNGYALGGLPNHTAVDVRSGRRHTVIVKRDIGGGGNSVDGVPREFDLYYPVAHWLAGADCNWTGVIEWRRYVAVAPRHHRRVRHHHSRNSSATLRITSFIWALLPANRVTSTWSAVLLQ